MNVEAIYQFLNRLSFREAVWLFPLAFILHVLEEYPHFTDWAQRYASPAFTRQDYVALHLTGIGLALLGAALVYFFPHRLVVVAFFTLMFTPSVFFNTLFHFGATALSGVYCPGLLTALTLYVPLFVFVSRLAYQEGQLTTGVGLVAFLVAGAFHFTEVGHNVFKLW